MLTQEQLLQAILDELKSSKQVLGFGHPPKARYVYANRQYTDCLWYFWNGAKNEHEPIEYTALTGVIEKLEIEEKEFRGKPDPKVNLHIRADRSYVIQSGLGTLFANGLLYSLLNIGDIHQPLTIAVEPGETEQVLFCRVYNPATGESVYAPYPEKTDWLNVAKQVIAKIGGTAVKPQRKTSTTVEQQAEPVETIEYNYTEEPIDRKAVMGQIKTARESIGWGQEQVVSLIGTLFDRTSPTQLTDEQLVDLLAAIEAHGSTELVPFEQTIATPKGDNYRKRIAAAKTESDCELIQVDLERDREILSDPICNKLLNDLQQVRRSILALPF